jgi:hypothetical protein
VDVIKIFTKIISAILGYSDFLQIHMNKFVTLLSRLPPPSNMKIYFCAAVVAIGILSGRLACGNGNEKTLVLQLTNKKSKARKTNCGKSSITERQLCL